MENRKKYFTVVWLVISKLLSQRLVVPITTIFVFCLALFLPGIGKAQGSYVAPAISYEFGAVTSIDHSAGRINHFSTSGEGISSGHCFGIGAQWVLPGLFTAEIGFSPQLEYRFFSGTFTSDPFTTSQYNYSAQSIPANEQFSVASIAHSLDLLLPVTMKITPHFHLSGGLYGAYEFARSLKATETILSPSEAQFFSGGKSREFASGDTIGASHLHAGIDLGIAYHFPITSTYYLEPSFHLRYEAAGSDVGSKALSAGLSIAIAPMNDVASAPAIASDSSTVKQNFELSGEIHFTRNGVPVERGSMMEVVGQNTYHRQYTELTNEIMFDYGSANLKQYRLLSPTEATSFGLIDLANARLPLFEQNVINIIGYRLRNTPGAAVIIHSSSTSESTELTQLRSDAIETYLREVWSIPLSSITKEKKPLEGTTGCQITSNVAAILAPVPTQWYERSYRIPHIGLDKQIVAKAGLRSWSIDISQNNKVLTRFSNKDSRGDSGIADFDLGTDSLLPSAEHHPAPLIATLQIEDFTGQSITVSDTLLLPSLEQVAGSVQEREEYQFTFLPNQSSATHDLLLEKCYSIIKKNANITIENPAPVQIGNSPINDRNIAEEVVRHFKGSNNIPTEIHIIQHHGATSVKSVYDGAIIIKIDQDKQ